MKLKFINAPYSSKHIISKREASDIGAVILVENKKLRNEITKRVNLHEDLVDMLKVFKEYEYEKLMPVTKAALDLLLKRIK